MDSDKIIAEIWRNHKWMLLLAVAGLVFAICVISYGFFKAVFIFVCVAVGVLVGMQIDKSVRAKRKPGGYY